ncbi:zinc finger, CCHC-type containing protein [Tanacetum coccineum]
MRFNPQKKYRHVSKKPNASSSGNKKKGVEPTIKVNNSNPFDVLNSVDNDVEFSTNRGTTNLVNNGATSSGSSFMNADNDGEFASNILIGEKIDKIEQQICEGKIRLLDNDGKLLVPMGILESDSEVEVVFDETVNLRILTSGKDGNDKGYGTNSLLEQWRYAYPDNDDYDPYNDDMYKNHDLYEHLQSICDGLDITAMTEEDAFLVDNVEGGLCVDYTDAEIVGRCNSGSDKDKGKAKDLWDSLKSKYMAEDSSSKKSLVSNFNNYKMVDSRPVMEQYNELLRILGQYIQHGLKIDESISVSSIIDKLPHSLKDFKHTLKHGKDDLSLVPLGSHLRIEESLRAQDSDKGKGKEVDGPSMNMAVEGKNKNNKQNKGKKRDFKEHGSGSGFNKKPKLGCWKCGKTGHFKRDCHSGNKKNANAGGSGKGSKDHSQDQDARSSWKAIKARSGGKRSIQRRCKRILPTAFLADLHTHINQMFPSFLNKHPWPTTHDYEDLLTNLIEDAMEEIDISWDNSCNESAGLPKYQENRANGRQEKKIVTIEDSNSKALVATDNNEDIDWTKEFDAEPTTFAMMALTEVEQDDWSMDL